MSFSFSFPSLSFSHVLLNLPFSTEVMHQFQTILQLFKSQIDWEKLLHEQEFSQDLVAYLKVCSFLIFLIIFLFFFPSTDCLPFIFLLINFLFVGEL